jgi:lytic starch monooxygenase
VADGSVLVYPPLRARRCGVAGGARTNMSFRAGGFGPETGYPQGFNGSQLPPIPKEQRRTWKLGSTASVSWVSVANHAGGYTYSLCPADEELTEECFDRLPLQFVDNTSTLRYMFLEAGGKIGPNRTEVKIPAHRVREGVLPEGSVWSRNPVPAGSWHILPSDPAGWQGNQEPPQFEPPPGCDEHCWGYQPCNVGFTHPSYEGWHHTKTQLPNCSRAGPEAPLKNGEGCCHTTAYMAIIDEVHVPQVPPGDYVVRWRWDCEQSPQIWSGCGDIVIV